MRAALDVLEKELRSDDMLPYMRLQLTCDPNIRFFNILTTYMLVP